ncbi:MULTISPECIES: hypothetical protein [Streptomyces]|uniref:Uncharacterized protein n=1 Tax=Streptomyces fradiae ATCC 10745 = DSM 40063 TaxID=1319510 RepID=A0A1Y2NV32_STRFR|nr:MULTISPECIES: hypothetical protein [Streptomyces]KAF0651732.1 hypothetical protein K701_02000 [Streptomyces fradiae ATCC 10745 = DSM 40063]OSY50788.1 hypothetical protein BG846_03586 [Streptomyces fradiae ATCC 10745 = DSM 40063]QEV11159.1 hypothetical protein CP974_03075 [Streptomyces fradiae ATCC 10745 = DSM 40063]
MSDYVQGIKSQALSMDGENVALNLVGGQSLTGTLAYETVARLYSVEYPDVLTITVAGKAHVVRLDHVSSIGAG